MTLSFHIRRRLNQLWFSQGLIKLVVMAVTVGAIAAFLASLTK